MAGSRNLQAMNTGTIIEVVGAIIKDGGKYLVGQRAAHKTQGGLWEFMGGKIEPGETPQQALKREIFEELGADCTPADPIYELTVETDNAVIHLTFIRTFWAENTVFFARQ
jgi:8-oxo-dGTP diphosphatase